MSDTRLSSSHKRRHGPEGVTVTVRHLTGEERQQAIDDAVATLRRYGFTVPPAFNGSHEDEAPA